MTPFIDQLLNWGSLGLFAAFLMWLYYSTRQRADALAADYDARIEGMRERYGIVIDGLRAESREQHEGYMRRLDKIDGTLREIRIRMSAISLREGGDITSELEHLADD